MGGGGGGGVGGGRGGGGGGGGGGGWGLGGERGWASKRQFTVYNYSQSSESYHMTTASYRAAASCGITSHVVSFFTLGVYSFLV